MEARKLGFSNEDIEGVCLKKMEKGTYAALFDRLIHDEIHLTTIHADVKMEDVKFYPAL